MMDDARDKTCVDWDRSPLRIGGTLDSYFLIADRQTTIGGLLPYGGKTYPADVDVRAHRVGIFACQGNGMGTKQKGATGQGTMMSQSEEERKLCDDTFVENCVSVAAWCDRPLIIGLRIDCYGTKEREMLGPGYKVRVHELMKKVWDTDVPCLPGDCLSNQINNHPDYTRACV